MAENSDKEKDENEVYREVFADRKVWWKKQRGRPVLCPVLEEEVHLNAMGFRHALYKTDGRARNIRDRIRRMVFMKSSISVIANTKKIARYESFSSKYFDGKTVQQWGLVSKVGDDYVSVRVVIQRIGGGKLHLYSIFPERK